MDEQCEICGKKIREVGQLFGKASKDDLGRPTIIMVCPKCLIPRR